MISLACHLADSFLKLAENLSVKELLYQLSKLKTFLERQAFCDQHFTKLGSGTARIVYLLEGDLVVKLAKNTKGLAQNRAESDGFLHTVPVANSPLDADPNNLWILTRLAKRVNESEFQAMTGMKFKDYTYALRYWNTSERHGEKIYTKPEFYDEIKNNEFFQDVTDMIGNMDYEIGDLTRISSYGSIDGKVKIVDLGLTNSVYQEFYK